MPIGDSVTQLKIKKSVPICCCKQQASLCPPSFRRSTGLPYVFKRGTWDDLDRLPFSPCPGSLSLHFGETGAGELPVRRGQRNNQPVQECAQGGPSLR